MVDQFAPCGDNGGNQNLSPASEEGDAIMGLFARLFGSKSAMDFYNRGVARAKDGDYSAAIKNYTKAIALNPGYAQAYHRRAGAYFAKRDYDNAWVNVKACRKLGVRVDPVFLDELRKTSGRRE